MLAQIYFIYQNWGRYGMSYSLPKKHQLIRWKFSGSCEADIFREDGSRITCLAQSNDGSCEYGTLQAFFAPISSWVCRVLAVNGCEFLLCWLQTLEDPRNMRLHWMVEASSVGRYVRVMCFVESLLPGWDETSVCMCSFLKCYNCILVKKHIENSNVLCVHPRNIDSNVLEYKYKTDVSNSDLHRIFTRFERQHLPIFSFENVQLQNHVKTKVLVYNKFR
jgi:hypothetical protein